MNWEPIEKQAIKWGGNIIKLNYCAPYIYFFNTCGKNTVNASEIKKNVKNVEKKIDGSRKTVWNTAIRSTHTHTRINKNSLQKNACIVKKRIKSVSIGLTLHSVARSISNSVVLLLQYTTKAPPPTTKTHIFDVKKCALESPFQYASRLFVAVCLVRLWKCSVGFERLANIILLPHAIIFLHLLANAFVVVHSSCTGTHLQSTHTHTFSALRCTWHG